LAPLAACNKSDDASREHAPPPPAPAASAGGAVCAGGGGQNSDPLSAPFVPRVVGAFCLDPQSEPKTYGDKGKLSMDEVCTTAFDGECEVYKRFGLDRVVVLRYVDGSGAPNSVEVNVSRFGAVDGAYAMFTKRVVADGDPARASVKPLGAGGAGAISSSNAYVWRGLYLVELTFVTEDPKMTPEAMAAANERSTGAIAQGIGAKLPGSTDPPGGAAVLPAQSRLPLGIAYDPKDALGMSGIGPVAVGYYQDGEKRWRDVAIVRSDVAGAVDAFRVFKQHPGATSLKGLGDEAAVLFLQEAPDRPKAEYIVARKGSKVLAVGDEELVLEQREQREQREQVAPSDKSAPQKLTKDEKAKKLAAWVFAPG
jgi:hypothetical protein